MEPKTAIDETLAYQSFFSLCKKITKLKIKLVGYWEPPTVGTFKLNVDGTIFASIMATGIGAILLNSSGDVVMATSMREKIEFNPTTIECMANRGLQLCLNLGISNLLMESYFQVIVQAIQEPENSFDMLKNVVHDIWTLMSHFIHCEIQFRYGSSNELAHKLAHYA